MFFINIKLRRDYRNTLVAADHKGSDPRLLGTVWEKVESEVQRLDKMLNRFDPESEVSFVNREAGHYPVTVGEELWNILLNCKRYNELTEGYFDITLQGFDLVLLTEEDKSIFFFSESLHIDLGGYGKGYALAKIRELSHNFKSAIRSFVNGLSRPTGQYSPHGCVPTARTELFPKLTSALPIPFSSNSSRILASAYPFPSAPYREPAYGNIRGG